MYRKIVHKRFRIRIYLHRRQASIEGAHQTASILHVPMHTQTHAHRISCD